MTLTERPATTVIAVLAVSLALNFAWLGFTVSRWIQPRQAELSAERLVSMGPSVLPADLRAKIAAELKPRRDDVRAATRAVRQARQDLLKTMRSEPFDRAGIEAAFAALRQKLDDLSAIGEVAIADGLEQATPEMRAAIPVPGEGR